MGARAGPAAAVDGQRPPGGVTAVRGTGQTGAHHAGVGPGGHVLRVDRSRDRIRLVGGREADRAGAVVVVVAAERATGVVDLDPATGVEGHHRGQLAIAVGVVPGVDLVGDHQAPAVRPGVRDVGQAGGVRERDAGVGTTDRLAGGTFSCDVDGSIDATAVDGRTAGEHQGRAAADRLDVGPLAGRRGRPLRDRHLARADWLTPSQPSDHVADGPPGGTGLGERVVPVAVVPAVGIVVARIREIGRVVVGGRVVVLVAVVHDPLVHVVVIVIATCARGGCHEQRTQRKRSLFPLHSVLLCWRRARRNPAHAS